MPGKPFLWLHETAPPGYTDGINRLHGLCKHKKRHFGAAREGNLFLSRGKYIFLGRKKITPPVDACPVTRVTRLHGYTGGYVAFVYFPTRNEHLIIYAK